MRRNYIILTIIILILGIIFIRKARTEQAEDIPILYEIQRGNLEFYVYATGSLDAEFSTNVDAPKSVFNRDLQIWEIPITDIVEEGTIVDSGEYVASLDQNLIQEKLIKAEEELEMANNSMLDAQLDSSLTLNNKRDAIISAQELVEEKELILAESKYESPATIQKSKMDKEKALRKLAQEKQSFELEQQRSATSVKQKEIDYERKRKRVDNLHKVLKDVVVTAPQKGMVIYYNNRDVKRTVGSMISSYSPTIATLPDMSTMISVAYVNEIDVSQVKINQTVELSIDAFPDKILQGKVVSIANIGRVVNGSDAKVFEVKIKVLSRDEELRPAMTTNNTILTNSQEDILYVPTETVFSNDSLDYVYNFNKKTYRQIVRIGDANENYTIIEEGVKEGDRILWVEPENADDLDIKGWDIFESIKNEKKDAKEKAKKEAEEMLKEKPKTTPSDQNKGGDNHVVIIG